MTGVVNEPILLTWEPGESPGLVNLIVSAKVADDLLAGLAADGVTASLETSSLRDVGADALSVVVTTVTNPAAWAATGLAVKAFLDRHKGKKITLGDDGEIEATSYSARDIERIMRSLARDEDERDQ